MKTYLLPILIVALVGITGVGAAIYVMKGKSSENQIAVTDTNPLPHQVAPTPPPPAPPETTDQSPPPAQTAMTPPTPPGNGYNNGQPGQGGRGAGMQRMFDQLGLTDAQKQQIAQIRQTITDRQQRRDAIRNVLTPEQQTQWDQLRAQFRNNRGGGNGGGGPGGDNNNGGQGGNGAPTPATTLAPASTPPPAN